MAVTLSLITMIYIRFNVSRLDLFQRDQWKGQKQIKNGI